MTTTQTHYMGEVSYELDRHGGVQAKNWRRKVANSAKRPPAVLMRTLSFPLELDIDQSQFVASDNLYNTVEGFKESSLGHLLLCAHLSGLSLFQNMAQAATARQAAQFPTAAFVKAMEDGLGIILPSFTPQLLLNLFQSVPRKNPPFNADEIASRIHSACFNKKMSDKTDDNLREVFLAIAGAAVSMTESYADLKANALQALAACGETLRKQSPLFPSLAINLASNPREICLAYDGIVDPVIDGESQEYWLHHVLACRMRHDSQASPAQIQDSLLSFSNNALSQLFGALLFSADSKDGYLRTVDTATFCTELGVPASRASDADRFLKAARAIASPQFFVEGGYANYRPAVAGKLRSWVSNYLTRLQTLDEQVRALKGATLPDTSCAQLVQILDGLGLQMEDLQAIFTERHTAVVHAADSLLVLRGLDVSRRPIQSAQDLVAQLKSIADVHGTLRAVLNQINQCLEESEDPVLGEWKTALAVAESDVFVLPGISGGTDDVAKGLDEINDKLRFYFTNVESFAAFIHARSSRDIQSYLASLHTQELKRAGEVAARKLTSAEALALAKRRLLQGLYRLSKRLSPERQARVLDWLKPVVVNSGAKGSLKIFNRLKFNDQGKLYKSPWSPGRHQPLPICEKTLDATAWRDLLDALQSEARAELMATPSAWAMQDYLEILRYGIEIAIGTIGEAIPLTELKAAVALGEFDLHFKLRTALAKESVSAADLSSLLAWLGSQLSKMRFFARRTQFIVRHKFSRVGQDDLILVPKDKPWLMPRKYFAAKGGIGKLLRERQLVEEDANIAASELFNKAASIPLGAGSGHLLKQIPHDWFLPLEIQAQTGSEIAGLPVGKDSVRAPEKVRKLRSCSGAKLTGPSSYLSQLSGMLTGETEAKEWMLILDWTYNSSLVFENGAPKIAAQPAGCIPRVAIPIEHRLLPKDSIGLFDYLVAIDLGERQIGYAVFSVKDALTANRMDPIIDPQSKQRANGAIRIAGVNNLINAVQVHRSTQAANSKLKQNYDRRLEMLRDSVGSETVQRIEALCARFGAFPVLESSVVNFQTGSRQIDLVYGDVVRHFTYSRVDAHTAARKEHWMGAEHWVHPYLMARTFDETTQKRTGKPKPLNLFPGAAVHPAGTSQVCTACNRNAREGLRQTGERITVAEGGTVQTPAGEIQFLLGMNYSEEEFYRAKRDKRNLPQNSPLKAGTYSLREMIGFEARTRRQKNPSQMASDTTQSRFQCLFTDCRASYHADAGAAINIGRKFFNTIIDQEASVAALAAMGS